MLTACAQSSDGIVEVTPPERLDDATTKACRAVTDALPRELDNAFRRNTRPSPQTTAAWGDPPIVLRCGVPEGNLRDEPFLFDGVRWAMHDTGASRTWTTRDRRVNVQVVIPDAYEAQAELLGALAEALTPTR